MDEIWEFLQYVSDYITSIISGLAALLSSFLYIFTVGSNPATFTWLPSSVVTVMSLSLIIVIILRVAGR